MVFLDTNILVYAALNQDAAKHAAAAKLVRDMLVSGEGAISAQVVNEFSNVMFKRTRRTAENIRALNDIFRPMLRLDITAALVDTAILVKERFGLKYYDALIVAAAQEIGCEKIYSEDMSSGCSYGGVTVENPFEGL